MELQVVREEKPTMQIETALRSVSDVSLGLGWRWEEEREYLGIRGFHVVVFEPVLSRIGR